MDFFFLDTSIIFNLGSICQGQSCLIFIGLVCKKMHSNWGFKRHYSEWLQLICQSCHIAWHESLISQENPCEEGNNAVLFIALHLHVIAAQSLINSGKVKTVPTLNISLSLWRERNWKRKTEEDTERRDLSNQTLIFLKSICLSLVLWDKMTLRKWSYRE